MIALHPFNGACVALVAVSLIGDTKGEWWSDSATEAMAKAADLVRTPDTLVDVFNTTNEGERAACTARISYNQVSGHASFYSLL